MRCPRCNKIAWYNKKSNTFWCFDCDPTQPIGKGDNWDMNITKTPPTDINSGGYHYGI